MIAAKVMAHTTSNRNKEYKFAICLVFVFVVTSCVYGEQVFHLRDHSDQNEYLELQTGNTVRTVTDAAAFLCKYGYLRPTASCNTKGSLAPAIKNKAGKMTIVAQEDGVQPRQYSEAEITEALKKWQKSYKISATGKLSDETKRAMSQERCGNPDSKDGKIPETLEESSESVGKRRGRRDVADSPLLRTMMDNNDREIVDTEPGSGRSRRHASMEEHSVRRRREIFSEYLREAEQGLEHSKRQIRKADFASFKERRRRKRMTVWTSPVTGHNYTNINGASTKFNKKIIRWRIKEDGFSSHIPQISQRATFRLAFRMWSEVIPLVFLEDPHSPIDKIDIVISFARGFHPKLNCQHKFDGLGGEIAHSFPGGHPNPFIHLDDDEPYRDVPSNSNIGIYLLKIVVHEIGHVLSLPHTSRESSVMYAVYKGYMNSQFFELEKEDRKQVQQVYGTCKGKFNTVFDWLRPKPSGGYVYNTYFFRGHWYWLYENKFNRTRYGDPLLVRSEWNKLPNDIDAYAQILEWQSVGYGNSRGVFTYYFYKGEDVYKYDSHGDKVMPGWPKKIRNVYKPKYNKKYTEVTDSTGKKINVTNQIPDNLDSAFYDSRDGYVYFFKGKWVWVYNPNEGIIGRGCCVTVKRFKDLFPPAPGQTSILEGDIDAAYYSYSRKKFYFFKGEEVWINKGYKRLTRGKNSLEKLGKWDSIWHDICEVNTL